MNYIPFMAISSGHDYSVGVGDGTQYFASARTGLSMSDIYAVTALTGSASMITGLKLDLLRSLITALGAVVYFVLRIVSVSQHWNLNQAIVRRASLAPEKPKSGGVISNEL